MASNFSIAFRVLPPDRRKAIEAVYAFCRKADDAADEASDADAGRSAFENVRCVLDAGFAGNATEIPGFSEAIARFALPRRPFDDLLEGVRWDLEGRRYATREALREYCYRVASTVGLLCVRIFGCREGVCDLYAEEMGIALQWTNILRDIRPDLELDRVYVPAASLDAHRLSENDLRAPSAAARVRIAALVRDEASFARARFASAASALPPSERSRVLSGEIMAEVYRSLLSKVERLGDRVLDTRARLSAPRRAWIAGRVLLNRRRLPEGVS